ncbi:uncharacterized protein LOC119739960 [Patiria miniata]|uniref:RING-type E3 ubiquitin transferase n=1 Tax=Patiria miniata TaxID=46514 RepID=A0A914B6F6_PATMI|nr:uncharacterized protein LOC119739960 [Patiria miniata]
MAAVAKRRSVFISNIPLASSVETLEGFLQQELESSGHDRGHLLKVIYPVSSSKPRQALATFQDEKAMVTLMRKRLRFEGEHLTMQPFLSQVFTSMKAVINPDVTELFPFNSQDFSRLLEKQSGVECGTVDEQDRYGGQPEQLYVLTGTWYQLQNARKFLQEWMVDETNRPRLNEEHLRDKDQRTVDVTSPSAVNGSQRSPHEETRGLANEGNDSERLRLTEDTVPRHNLEGDPTAPVAGESVESGRGGRRGARKAPKDGTKTKLEGRNVKVAASFKGPSNRISLGVDGESVASLSHHHPNSSLDVTPQDNSASVGSVHHLEPSESPDPTTQITEEVQSREDDFMRLPASQEISTDPTMHRNADVSTPPPSDGDSRTPEDISGRAFSTMSSERSEDRLTVGSSLDYMRHVKVPQTPLASVDSENGGREQFEADSVHDDNDTLSPRDDLERESTTSPQSGATITDGRAIDGDNEEFVEGMGSLPVDPGVFSYILLKQSDPIREIEEKFGVKFSMHATRDSDDTDVESALLKITPTRETAEIAQAHDEFVDFYSEIFSTLNHRAITTTDMTFNPESLRKTVDLIHELYQTVLLTVTKEKVLIYGSNESDVRLAKMLVLESLKKTPVDSSGLHTSGGIGSAVDSSGLQGQSGVSGQNTEQSFASGRVESPSAQPAPEVRQDENTTEVDRPGEYSQLRGDGSNEVDGTLQTQLRTPGNEPVFPLTDRLHSDPSDLEVDGAPQTQLEGRLTGPTARVEDEAVDYQHIGGPRRILNSSTASEAEPAASPSGREAGAEVTGEANEVTEPDRRNLVEDISNMANVIPVDPGVFAFIQTQKHTILCDIEQNYGIKFNVRGNLDSDVYMVEVESVGAVSETAAQQGKDAFANFYQEVFSGLEHRVVSLAEFENVTSNTLAEIIEEMEHSFRDLLFRVVGSRVLIYGQGRHNVNSAKDLICRRLRGSLSRPESTSQFVDDDVDLESLSSDSMVNRLYHLRFSSLSPVSPRAGQKFALTQNIDTLGVNGLPDAEREDPNSQDHLLSEENDLGHLPSQNPLPSVVEQQHTERNEHLKTLNGYSRLLEDPSDIQSARVRTKPDAKHRVQNDDPTQMRDAEVWKGTLGDVTYKFQDGRLILDLNSGICVRLFCGDITEMQVDVIVNAANETLSNIAGVAGAIRDAAGEGMQAECNRYVAHHGLLYPAKVVHTGSGNMPCTFVLHAVGPKWGDYPNKLQVRQTLKATIVKCLRTADEKLQVSSLAMPFISSGIFGVPLEVCIEEICKALLDVNRKRLTSPHGILQKVDIVDLDSGTVRQAQDIMIQTLCQEASASSEAVQGQDDTDMRETLLEPGNNVEGDYERNLTIPAANEDGVSRRGRSHKQREASARMSRSQRESVSSDEDLPHGNVEYKRMDDYSLPSSLPPMVRSTSLPYLPRDDMDDAGEGRWAYRTSGLYTSPGRELKEYPSRGRKPRLTGERGQEQAPSTRNIPNASPKETRQEKQVRELLDAFSRAPPSPELSRKTEGELNRLLSEQDKGARQKQLQRPVRRTQSLDRSRPRQKCFVCSSPRNLSKRKSCEHLICEICKDARLDVGRCRECSKAKTRKEPEKRCDVCLSSTKHLLLTCRDCENPLCVKCIGKGLDICQNCMKHMHSTPDGHAEKKPPKVRQPIVGARASRIDTKNDYRIKTSVVKDSTSTRRKPMLGCNQSVDVVAQGYARAGGVNGMSISNSTYPRNSAFSKELVAEEAPHEEILRRLSREQETKRQIFPKDTATVTSRSSVTDSSQTVRRHSRKKASKTDELQVIGQSSPPVLRPQEPMCAICMDKIKDPKSLQCKHTFCSSCIEKAFQFKPICPICGVSYGKLQGDQPDGSMNYTTVSSDLPGYPGCGTIIITYTFLNGIQTDEHPNPGLQYRGTQRQAYLPNNRQGQEVLKLLKTAFDARLLFTIGRSVTTGADNTVVWNDVHHKTSQTGGSEMHGYPDPTYLQRVRKELEAKGIK